MTPKTSTVTETLVEERPKPDYKHEIVWRNVILFIYLHAASMYGLYLVGTAAMYKTTIFATMMYMVSGLGITAGAHRLWAHKSYKAKVPLRIFLAFLNTCAFENDILEWARDHRVHHKYSETDADPHNATRGFFFSHIGWLLVRKHPDVREKGKNVDVSDLKADPVVAFQRKYYLLLVPFCCFVLPTWVPCYYWGETVWNSFFVAGLLRYTVLLHCTWLVNSAAHMWGNRPYDETINPRENMFVSLGAIGEGFHNYHHTFPWDYSTSEFGIKLNLTTMFINAMAFIGQAYDLKKVTKEMVKQRKTRTGETGHSHSHSFKVQEHGY